MKSNCWGKAWFLEIGAGSKLLLAFFIEASSSKYISCREVKACKKNPCVMSVYSPPGPQIVSIILKGRSLPITLWGASGKGVPLEGLIRANF